jgi:hypothetical protein
MLTSQNDVRSCIDVRFFEVLATLSQSLLDLIAIGGIDPSQAGFLKETLIVLRELWHAQRSERVGMRRELDSMYRTKISPSMQKRSATNSPIKIHLWN